MSKGIFPYFEVLFGIGEEIGDEGERGDHDEEGDDGLAEGDGEDTDAERDDGAEYYGDNKEDEVTETTGEGDSAGGDTGSCYGGAGGADDATDAVRPRKLDGVAALEGEGDRIEEIVETRTYNVADVYGEGADNEGDVDENGGDDEAGRVFLMS